MRREIKMPSLGYDMETGKIAGWLKEVSDSVERGEVIAEVETDKATVEMESSVTGVLAEIVLPAGAWAAVGDIIAYVDDAE